MLLCTLQDASIQTTFRHAKQSFCTPPSPPLSQWLPKVRQLPAAVADFLNAGLCPACAFAQHGSAATEENKLSRDDCVELVTVAAPMLATVVAVELAGLKALARVSELS